MLGRIEPRADAGLAARVGIESSEAWVPRRAILTVLEADPALVSRLVSSRRAPSPELGLFGHHARTAPDLVRVIDALAWAAPTLDETLRIRRDRRGLGFSLTALGAPAAHPRFLLAVLARAIHAWTGVRPTRCSFRGAGDPRLAPLARAWVAWGVEVRESADHALSFDPARARTAARHADARLHELLRGLVTSALRRLALVPPALWDIHFAILKDLANGPVRLSRVATEMGTSTRSLQRRLSEHQTSFRAVLDAARRELALELFADPDVRDADVRAACGLRDPRAFRRAMTRWTGQKPSRYRAELRARTRRP